MSRGKYVIRPMRNRLFAYYAVCTANVTCHVTDANFEDHPNLFCRIYSYSKFLVEQRDTDKNMK